MIAKRGAAAYGRDMALNRRQLLWASATVAGCKLQGGAEEPAPTASSVNGPDARIELDRAAIQHNIEQIRSRVGERPVMGVIKCNAYGHGLVPFAKELAAAGVEHLAVGKLDEALRLRAAGLGGTILNFGPFADAEAEGIVGAEISQAVWTDQVARLDAAAAKLGSKAKVHVNVDTGLGRVGVVYREAPAFLKTLGALKNVVIEGVFTALAEDPEHDPEQLSRLETIATGAKKAGIEIGLRHAASSAAVIDQPEAHLDMVRPGIALYGFYPNTRTRDARPIDLRPVLSLRAKVVMVKTLQPGDAVGYHRAFVAEKPTRLATIPVGYSDGFPPKVIGKAEVLIRGKRFPLVGMVTANHCEANLGDDASIAIGDEAVLIGAQGDERIAGETLSDAAGFSEYKLGIGMSALLPRIVV
jgi:alanine racemase